jgi:glycosyltransferase involved in cell wall biosynthesis
VHIDGAIAPDKVVDYLAGFDLFVLPSFGENFSHAVVESLLAGTPVVVGSDTPWKELEDEGAGWLCSPRSAAGLAAMIDRFFALDVSDRTRMIEAAQRLGRAKATSGTAIRQNKEMLMTGRFPTRRRVRRPWHGGR